VENAARASDLPILTSGVGSAFGLYVLDHPGGAVDPEGSALLHLAAVNHGVFFGSGGEFGLSTAMDELTLERAATGLADAIADVVAARTSFAGEAA
jgi:hypothetical protein